MYDSVAWYSQLNSVLYELWVKCAMCGRIGWFDSVHTVLFCVLYKCEGFGTVLVILGQTLVLGNQKGIIYIVHLRCL